MAQLRKSFKGIDQPKFILVGASGSMSMPHTPEEVSELVDMYKRMNTDVCIYRLHKVRKFSMRKGQD